MLYDTKHSISKQKKAKMYLKPYHNDIGVFKIDDVAQDFSFVLIVLAKITIANVARLFLSL